jgi:hypothetical protein
MTPSQYMFRMSMNTEQKLANVHTMNIPQKVELLDMSETTHQKVIFAYLKIIIGTLNITNIRSVCWFMTLNLINNHIQNIIADVSFMGLFEGLKRIYIPILFKSKCSLLDAALISRCSHQFKF